MTTSQSRFLSASSLQSSADKVSSATFSVKKDTRLLTFRRNSVIFPFFNQSNLFRSRPSDIPSFSSLTLLVSFTSILFLFLVSCLNFLILLASTPTIFLFSILNHNFRSSSASLPAAFLYCRLSFFTLTVSSFPLTNFSLFGSPFLPLSLNLTLFIFHFRPVLILTKFSFFVFCACFISKNML